MTYFDAMGASRRRRRGERRRGLRMANFPTEGGGERKLGKLRGDHVHAKNPKKKKKGRPRKKISAGGATATVLA
jgi:hypothetical protein